jgi:ABC-type antimicrobial peptide transport system permease subunit
VSYTLITVGGDPTGAFLPQFYFPVRDVIIGAVMTILLGFAAGAVPAFQAQRLRIVDALRRA